MKIPKFYTHIYYRQSRRRGCHLVFFNSENGNSLVYDGIQFYFFKNSVFKSDMFVELEYSIEKKGITIESIRSDFDISYIRFSNGDILQLFYLMDDEISPQQLLVFEYNKPSYKLAAGRFNNEPETEIEEITDKVNVVTFLNKEDI